MTDCCYTNLLIETENHAFLRGTIKAGSSFSYGGHILLLFMRHSSVVQNNVVPQKNGLTQMFYHPSIATKISQGMTGVQEQYRGAGKGKWLKAAMLLKVREEFPEVKIVSTGNATTNEPMLWINRALGFKKHK